MVKPQLTDPSIFLKARAGNHLSYKELIYPVLRANINTAVLDTLKFRGFWSLGQPTQVRVKWMKGCQTGTVGRGGGTVVGLEGQQLCSSADTF